MRNPQPFTRITIIIPAPQNDTDALSVDELVEKVTEVCRGSTVMAKSPPFFAGSWIDAHGALHSDDVMLIIADAPFALTDYTTDDWLDWLEEIKLWCQGKFDQNIVWITLTNVQRVTAFDYQKPPTDLSP